MSELNKSKVAVWKQMRIIEIIAADLADCLTQGGTKFEMEPARFLARWDNYKEKYTFRLFKENKEGASSC